MTTVPTLPPRSSIPTENLKPFAVEEDKYRGAVVEANRVLDRHRKPLGYVDVAQLKGRWEAGTADMNDNVRKYMTKFKRGPSEPYTLITPSTPLEELEHFLQDKLFALVTDYDRKFVLAVVTKQDLDNFVSRRGF